MTNKPSINDVTLVGNKSLSALGIQATLTSGTNIKTVNNQSLLGSGNINIEGGAVSSGSLWRSKLSGKKISILGDSISTYQGWLTPSSNAVYYPSCQGSPHADITSVDQTWWKIVIDKAQLTLGANNSYSGRKLTESATISNIQALGANGAPDIILVYLGTNDANQQVSLGSIDKTMPFNYNNSETYGETLGTNLTQEQINALGTSTFYEAVRTLIIRLQWYYPDARIVFLNIGWGSYQRFYADNPYREAIKAMCELMGVDLIDMRKAGINMPKFTDYTLQRVHPNKAGMRLLGEYVYNKLMSLYGYTSDETTLTNLTYSGSLTKTSYIAGESLDLTGLTFTASYADGTSETLDNAEIEVVPRPLLAGTTSATASYTYGGVKKSVTISGFTVEASTVELTSITSSGTLTKTQYSDGEVFDPTGLTFMANFSDSSSRQIEYEALTFSPSPLTTGTTSVTASYTFSGVTKTTSISGITVVASAELTSITSSGTLTKTQYSDGEDFDPTGLTFTANFSDSSSRQIAYEALTFSPSPLTTGTTSVVASYTFAGVTKTTTISGITVVAGLPEIDELPYATQGVTRDLRGGAVDYIITRPGVSQEELAGKTVKYIEGIYVTNSSYPSESKVLRIGKVTAPNIFSYVSGSAEGKQIFDNAVANFEEIATIDLSSYTNKQHFVLNNLNVTFGANEYLAFDDRNCHCVGFVNNNLTTRLSMVYIYNGGFMAENQLLMPLKIKYEEDE